jgi:hypothetical protein
MDVIREGFSEEDLEKIYGAGEVPDIGKQKVWSIVTGIYDPVSLSDAMKKIREAVLEVLPLELKKEEEKKVLTSFLEKWDTRRKLDKVRKINKDSDTFQDYVTKLHKFLNETEWNIFNDFVFDNKLADDVLRENNVSVVEFINAIEKGLDVYEAAE